MCEIVLCEDKSIFGHYVNIEKKELILRKNAYFQPV